MAATNNVNLLLNTQTNPNKVNPASSIRSTYFARKTYNVNRNSAGSFNNVLDRINSAPQQNTAPRDTYKSSSVESTAKSSSNDVRNPKPKDQDVSSTPMDKAPADNLMRTMLQNNRRHLKPPSICRRCSQPARNHCCPSVKCPSKANPS